jgi:uncharacterized metal-binding protein
MPSGRTHDAITILLAPVACGAAYMATRESAIAAVVAVAFVFGGLMFGPDLDTVSRQYSRWSVLRFLWYPYRAFFPHRSRFTHGLLFGALLRVIYFLGIVSVVTITIALGYAYLARSAMLDLSDLQSFWSGLGSLSRRYLPAYFLPSVFVGMWLGAASHTFTDMAGSFVKTGRVAKFL